jgi:hypothetical protein
MRARHLLVIAFVLLATSVGAQEDVASNKTETGAGVAARITKSASDSVTQVAPVFSIEGSTANKIASGQIAFQLTDLTITVGAQTPLGDTAKSATLADLDGLKSKTTGKFSLMWQHWDASLETYQVAFARACQDNSAAADSDCTYLHFKRDTSEAGKARFKELRRKINPGTVYFAGMNAQIGPEEFKYLDKTDLTPGTVRHVSWSASGFFGVLFADGVMVAGNYKREVSYQGNAATQLCTPLGSTGASTCSQKVLGAPGDPTRSHQTGIEIRKIVNQYFAISPKVTRDWHNDSTGAEVPIYFFRDKDGGLNGGISLGYLFEKKSFTATAFVGQVLGLISR